MGELIGGRWHRTGIDTVLSEGTLRRPPSIFRDWVKADKDAPFRAEAGRYNIYDAFRSPARSAAPSTQSRRPARSAISASATSTGRARLSEVTHHQPVRIPSLFESVAVDRGDPQSPARRHRLLRHGSRPQPGRSAARGNRRPAGWRRRPVAHNRSRADRRERRHSSIALTPAAENRRQFSGIQNFGNKSRLVSDHPVAAPSPRTLRFWLCHIRTGKENAYKWFQSRRSQATESLCRCRSG